MKRPKTKSKRALEVSRRGLPVFPLKPNSKVPLISNWRETATTDPDQIRACWALCPDANIGIPTTGFLVLDLTDKCGPESIVELKSIFEQHSEGYLKTVCGLCCSESEGKSAFAIYALPLGASVEATPDLLVPGVGVLASNDFIVAPGSTIDDVRWDFATDRLAVADAPKWLMEMCKVKSTPRLDHRTDVAIKILWALDPRGRHDLAAIDPLLPAKHPGKIEAATFQTSQRDAASVWIEARQGIKNIYTSVNRASGAAAASNRLAKKDVGTIRAVVADLDPGKIKGGDASGENFVRERARLLKVVNAMASEAACPPTLIVDSGGGYQAWWQLAEPLPATAESVALVEGIGRTIQNRYGGDPVWNIDRIMRLPGTVNVPDPEKAAQGRTPALSGVLPLSTGLPVTLEALQAWAPPTAPRAKQDAKLPEIDMGALPDADDYGELPSELRDRFEAARKRDAVLDKLWGGQPAPEQKDVSPSGFSYALAGRLKRAGEFTAIDFGALLRVWDHRSEKEIDARRIARDWGNNPMNGTSSGFESREISNRPKSPASGKVAAAPPTDWNEPTDLWVDNLQPASLPAGVLPDLVERVARDRGLRLGVEAGAPAAALVTVLGSLVPAGNRLQMRQHDPDWRVKPIQWTAIIGPPGSNKSATIGYAVSAVEKLEGEWRKTFAAAERKRKISESRRAVPTKAKPENLDDVFADEPTEKPRFRQKLFNDATTEALAVALSENPEGLLYHSDELAGWLGGMDAYRAKGGKDRPFWLQAKEGGPFTVNRKTSERICVENCAISVLGGIQPDKIRALKLGMSDDGLLQRFAPITIRRDGNGLDIPPDTSTTELLTVAAAAITGSDNDCLFRFSPEADAELHAVEAFKAREIGRPDASSMLRQWLDKMPNEFGRLSLIFHFIEWYASEMSGLIGGGPSLVVERSTAERARRYLTEFVYSHAKAFYLKELGSSEMDEHALWIAGFVLSRERTTIDTRDIYRSYPALRQKDQRSDIAATMRVLEMYDWAKPIGERGGTATRWAINPAVHDGRFADTAEQERSRRGNVREAIRQEAEARRETLAG
jgi:hypothetical protein